MISPSYLWSVLSFAIVPPNLPNHQGFSQSLIFCPVLKQALPG